MKAPQLQNTEPAAASPGVAGTRIRIGVADDYSVVRAGLEQLFQGYPDFSVVGTVASARDALALAGSGKVDVMVLDIMMGQDNVVDVLERMAACASAMAIVIYSAYPEEQFALPLIRLGARAYVEKSAPVMELVNAVRAVAGGATCFSEKVQKMLWMAVEESCAPGAQGSRSVAGLTAREFQIFLRLAGGQTVTEIASALSLSDVTISAHRSRVLQKLNLSSNSHLTRYAIDNHLLS